MEKRKITKSMQEVLESPEFIKTQTQIVDIIQKYRLFASQLNEAFEKIRVPIRTLNTALLNEASPIHNLSQNLSATLSQISEFINSYEEAGSVPNIPTSANTLIQKKEQKSLLLEFVIPAGFEPTTHSLEGCCSIQLSYGTIANCGAKVITFPLKNNSKIKNA